MVSARLLAVTIYPGQDSCAPGAGDIAPHRRPHCEAASTSLRYQLIGNCGRKSPYKDLESPMMEAKPGPLFAGPSTASGPMLSGSPALMPASGPVATAPATRPAATGPVGPVGPAVIGPAATGPVGPAVTAPAVTGEAVCAGKSASSGATSLRNFSSAAARNGSAPANCTVCGFLCTPLTRYS